MKPSIDLKIRVLAILAAALAAALALGLLLSPTARNARANAGRIADPDLQAADRIVISGDDSYELRRGEGGTWSVRFSGLSRPARPARVDDFLAKISAIDIRVPVASHSFDRERFGLSEGSRRVIAYSGERTLADFLVGSYGPTGRDVYVLLADTPDVFAVDSSFNSYLVQGRVSWHDLSLSATPVEFSSVDSLKIESRVDGKAPYSYELRKQSGEWSATGTTGLKLDAKRIEALLRQCLTASGSDFADEAKADASFASPLAIIEAIAEGRSIRIVFGKTPSDDHVYVRRSDGLYSLIASTWLLESLVKPLEAYVATQ
jgi:hypothetical protein